MGLKEVTSKAGSGHITGAARYSAGSASGSPGRGRGLGPGGLRGTVLLLAPLPSQRAAVYVLRLLTARPPHGSEMHEGVVSGGFI